MTPIDAYSCTLFMWWEQKVWDKDIQKHHKRRYLWQNSHKDVKEDFRIELIVIIMKQDIEGRVDFKVMIGSNTNSNLTNHFSYHTDTKTTKVHTWLNMINIKCSWNWQIVHKLKHFFSVVHHKMIIIPRHIHIFLSLYEKTIHIWLNKLQNHTTCLLLLSFGRQLRTMIIIIISHNYWWPPTYLFVSNPNCDTIQRRRYKTTTKITIFAWPWPIIKLIIIVNFVFMYIIIACIQYCVSSKKRVKKLAHT